MTTEPVSAPALAGRSAILQALEQLPDTWRGHPALRQLQTAVEACSEPAGSRPTNASPTPGELCETRELLELVVRSGRRCAYDLRHAIECLGMCDKESASLFDGRAEHWLTVFDPARGPKDYRTQLHLEIARLEGQLREAEAFIGELQAKLANKQLPQDAGDSETLTVQEAWEASGGNPGIRATKQDLFHSLAMLDAICDAADARETAVRNAAEAGVECPSLTNDGIRSVFMAHGFTVKQGLDDLKPYVYDAARALAGVIALKLWESQPPRLAVWFGALPESNGKQNWTAILHRADESMMDGVSIECSEYTDRVRYTADRLRHLIGQLPEAPDILTYDSGLQALANGAPEATRTPVQVQSTHGIPESL